MNETKAWQAFFRECTILLKQVIGYAIDERAAWITACGMHYETNRFIDDEHFIVLVNNVNRDILRNDFFALNFFVGINNDFIAGFDAIISGDVSIVDEHSSTFNCLLHFVPASI